MLAWAYITLLVFALPLLAFRSARMLNTRQQPQPTRSALHFNTLAMLCVLLGLSVAVARKENVSLFPAWQPGWIDAAALVGFLCITLSALAGRIGSLKPSHRDRLEMITMTNWRDPRQLLPYAAVCVMAGIAEEVAYRGVLTELLLSKTGSLPAAIIIAALAFGAAHSVQGWTGIILTALFALLFHIVVLVTGNLYVAMIGHAGYDLIAGIIIAEFAMRRRAAVRSASSVPTAASQPQSASEASTG